ncbi:MAG: CaiB/BaiF CoA transferase family protein [Acidimicrobiia bacterium]
MLQSVKVADFSTHFPGPLAGHLLAELGADVVKIESVKGGDGNREMSPKAAGTSVFHAVLSSGARSIAVDRRDPAWDEVLAAAARWADVVLVAGPEPLLKARGLDFATFAALNDRVVYCMISGYGSAGPLASWPAHGQGPDALAGSVQVVTDEQGRFTTDRSWRGYGTTLSGLFGALAITSALVARDAGAGAQCCEVAMWTSSVWGHWRDIGCLANAGEMWSGTKDLGSRYRMYRTRDDRALHVAPIEQKFWVRFCEIVGLPEDLAERGDWTSQIMDFGDGPAYADEVDRIQAGIGTETLDTWVERLGEAGIPIAPVLTLAEALGGEHAAAQGVLREVPGPDGSGPLRIPRIPVRMRTAAGDTTLPDLAGPPELGEHTAEVRREWGLDG